MQLTINRINRPEAAEYLAWQYPEEYSTYSIPEAKWAQTLDEIFAENGDDYYSAYDGEEFVGIFDFEFPNGELTLRLGMIPEMTGRGLGQAFAQAGIDFARQRFRYHGPIHVAVAAFDQRAQKVFAALGFVDNGQVESNDTTFVQMTLAAKGE